MKFKSSQIAKRKHNFWGNLDCEVFSHVVSEKYAKQSGFVFALMTQTSGAVPQIKHLSKCTFRITTFLRGLFQTKLCVTEYSVSIASLTFLKISFQHELGLPENYLYWRTKKYYLRTRSIRIWFWRKSESFFVCLVQCTFFFNVLKLTKTLSRYSWLHMR